MRFKSLELAIYTWLGSGQALTYQWCFFAVKSGEILILALQFLGLLIRELLNSAEEK